VLHGDYFDKKIWNLNKKTEERDISHRWFGISFENVQTKIHPLFSYIREWNLNLKKLVTDPRIRNLIWERTDPKIKNPLPASWKGKKFL
jgi:hypothetical protein